jgi:hypothetical protein
LHASLLERSYPKQGKGREELKQPRPGARHAAWIQGDLGLGFEAVYLHNVGGEPERFIEVFVGTVLPACGVP